MTSVAHVLLSTVACGDEISVAVELGGGQLSILPDAEIGASDLDGVLRRWADDWPGLRGYLEDAVAGNVGVQSDGEEFVRLAPLRSPRKMILVGLNYFGHCQEVGREPPDEPLMLAKFPSSISGPTDDIAWSEAMADKVDYEAELGVVIGATLKDVDEREALGGVAGYVAINDVSARDVQWHDGQWVRGKSFDTFCPMGPSLFVPLDRIVEPTFRLRAWVNGELRQEDTTANMIFSVANTVSYLSRSFTLEPGDVILTGTPAGTARAHSGAGWLKDDDLVEVEVSGIGILRNRCRTTS
jgi:2-keto-4-pentenoate hydratase/2-oxohepta-3-ene-1,7-dioic acid hydratase in catechol pathway